MGIDIEWKMIQGASLEEWEVALEKESGFQEWEGSAFGYLMEVLEVDSVSPYYDACSEHCYYGYTLASGDGVTEINLPKIMELAEAHRKDMLEEFGLATITVCSQNVW